MRASLRRLPSTRLVSMTALLVGLLGTVSARAQYMYLDSNGDGIHSAADALASSGTTTVDVWLVTGRNRDGSPAICADAGTAFTIFSYEFCLTATDGRVVFSNFVNHMDAIPIKIFAGGNATQFYALQLGPTPAQPPGLYRLATVSVAPSSGTPSLAITPDATSLAQEAGPGTETAFGSNCPGVNFANTIQLGVDWFDVDGLPPGPPVQGHAPVLAPLTDMSVDAGALAIQSLHATDSDADAITFALESGPSFLDATTEDPGLGSASGTLHAGPHRQDIGMQAATVAATDGILAGRVSLQVRVGSGPNHPPLLAVPDRIAVVAGSRWANTVLVRDFDGQPLTMQKISGPDFLSAGLAGDQGEGGAVGYVRASPSLCDAGDYDATVAASDGLSSTQAAVHIAVRPAQAAPPSDLIPLVTAEWPAGVAVGDLNGDGLGDVVVANEVGRTVSVFVSKGGGQFAAERAYGISPYGSSLGAVVLADFNQDGHLDAAVAARKVNTISILFGVGDGTFVFGPVLAGDLSPEDLLALDMNDDGHVDLVAANGGTNSISVFLGSGNGTFAPRLDTRMAGAPYGLAAGDWNRDGRMDLAVAGFANNSVWILLGHGDGTFRTPMPITAGRSPSSVGAGDWDHDGALDLAVTDYGGPLVILRGDGHGGFTKTAELGSFQDARFVTVGDLSGDGNDDLVVSALTNHAAQVYQGDGRGGFTAAEAIALPGGAYQSAIGDMDGDAVPDLAMSDFNYGAVFVRRFPPAAAAGGFARAFVTGDHRPVPLKSGTPAYCVRLEPVDQSFGLEDIDPNSLRMTSDGTGVVSEIPAVSGKGRIIGDMDRNGVQDLSVCFSGQDLGQLFSKVVGRADVKARLEGNLMSGLFFCTSVVLTVQGSNQPLAASVSPNPLNPRGALRFTTSRAGAITVNLYDLQGRRVRTLARISLAEPGEQRIDIDGRTDTGTPLASGIYFYRVETPEGSAEGRFSILK